MFSYKCVLGLNLQGTTLLLWYFEVFWSRAKWILQMSHIFIFYYHLQKFIKRNHKQYLAVHLDIFLSDAMFVFKAWWVDFINICCFKYSRFLPGVFPGFPINIAIFRMLCYCLATIISMMKWNKNHGSLSKQQAGLMRDFDANASKQVLLQSMKKMDHDYNYVVSSLCQSRQASVPRAYRA